LSVCEAQEKKEEKIGGVRMSKIGDIVLGSFKCYCDSKRGEYNKITPPEELDFKEGEVRSFLRKIVGSINSELADLYLK